MTLGYSYRVNGAAKGDVTGSWALITGCTSGIGESYADDLARRGFNLLLLSRSADKLKALQDRLVARYRVAVDTLPVDALAAGATPTVNKAEADTQASVYRRITEWVADRPVTILINNVGVGRCNIGTYTQAHKCIQWYAILMT
jgi:17beta-estradiol 17-dehydrogenase / very-long-chain 3-oxoacyl-CoA reductase